MNEITLAITFGIIGAAVRALSDLLYARALEVKSSFNGVITYVLLISIIGIFASIVLSFSPVLSFLGGYAGVDLVAGYYKLMISKKIAIKKKTN